MSAVREARIATRCPSCGSSTLIIGGGNWLVCSLIGCKDPMLINSAGERLKAYWDNKEKAQRDLATVQGERERYKWLVQQLYTDLPAKRDWLAPAIERELAALAQPAAPSMIDRMAHINNGCKCRICEPNEAGGAR